MCMKKRVKLTKSKLNCKWAPGIYEKVSKEKRKSRGEFKQWNSCFSNKYELTKPFKLLPQTLPLNLHSNFSSIPPNEIIVLNFCALVSDICSRVSSQMETWILCFKFSLQGTIIWYLSTLLCTFPFIFLNKMLMYK